MLYDGISMTFSIREQVMGHRTALAIGNRRGENEGALEGPLLCLGHDDGYMNLYTCKNLFNCAQKKMLFTVCSF